MTANLQQLLAASALLVSAEKIASMGVLPENEEAELRRLIIRVCGAFAIPTLAERGESNVFELVRSPAVFRR